MGLNQLWLYKDHFQNLRFDKTMSEKAKMDFDDQNFALGKKVANEKSILSHLGQSWCKLVKNRILELFILKRRWLG